MCTFPFLINAQADLEVERNGILEKTLVISGNSFSSNNEIVIDDFLNNGSSILKLDDGVRKAIMGIDNALEGITGTISPHPMSFFTGGQARITLNAAGQVGLGTSNPGVAFHVSDPGISNTPTEVAILESGGSNKPVLLFSEGGLSAGNTMGILYDGSGTGASEKLQIINDASNPIVTWTNNELMGIGTENPRDNLDVIGNVAISSVPGSLLIDAGTSGDAELKYDGINLTLSSTSGESFIIADRRVILEAQGSVILDAEDGIFFQVNGSTKMNCTQSGNWGMNNTNPSARFHIKQNTTNLPALRIENDTDTDDWAWEVDLTVLNLSFNGTNEGFYNTNGSYQLYSDRRLKSDITPIDESVLSSVLKLKPCSYYFKKDLNSEHKTIGFIAQEMREQFPKLVAENDDEDSDILGIKYSLISVYAVKAVQEQNKEIKELNSNVQSLNINEKELKGLSSELANIEKRINRLK